MLSVRLYPFLLDIIFIHLRSSDIMARIDPYNHQRGYCAWKKASENGIKGLSAENGEILRQYLHDMENGFNVAFSHKKGARSYVRLNTMKVRMMFLMREFHKRFQIDSITNAKEEQVCVFFNEMRKGLITKRDGSSYRSTKDYVINFKAFWHWHQRANRKRGIEIPDITVDLDASGEKPRWVYLTEEEIKKLAERAKSDYRVLIYFLFDSGIRSPTELMNIRVSDFYNDYRELNIRQETSKTFGRRIKLMICSDLIKNYIKNKGLKENDTLFKTKHYVINRYLKRLGKIVLGDRESPAGQKYSELTMYDFRHCSCCYWLPKYKSESALKYRFGWKKSDKIHYYSEMLGMKDTISEEDLLVDVTKTEIEQKLQKSEKEKEIMRDQINDLQTQMAKISELTEKLMILKGED